MKLSRNKVVILTVIVVISQISVTLCDEVFGCGGFVKSHASIDFSKVEIKLLTKQGSVKDKTDCSPSNGYYFIPVYDKGDYILKVSPPSGWSFEPDQIEISFDGKTDLCSQGKDINFQFKGFGITGTVGILGQTIGARDVRVEMIAEKGNDVRQTFTDRNGIFEFTPVIPGSYIIRASHDRWSFAKSEYKVNVQTKNTEIPADSLIVSGFDVHGNIFSDGQAFKDVQVALYPAKGQKSMSDCKKPEQTILQTGQTRYEAVPICLITTADDGTYIFSAISPGKYLIKPFFQSQNIKYHVKPEFVEVDVVNDGVQVKDNFEITGFDVSGRVLTAKSGKGVAGADIKLNGDSVAKSMANGSYVLQNIKSGTFTIQVTADSLKFIDHTVKIMKTNPQIPDIVVSEFKVCGTVVSQKSHSIGITKAASTFHVTVESDPRSGEWCNYLSPGKYSVEVITSEQDRQNGIQFFPISHDIEVIAEPQSGIVFSQLRATVYGSVQCLPDDDNSCDKVSISMNALDTKGNYNRQYNTAEIKNGEYSFSEVLPGTYEISITQATPQNYCWQNQKFKYTIKSSEERLPPFVHTGYLISIVSSHKTEMTYRQRTTDNATPKKMSLIPGSNQFCVAQSGIYELTFAGCHTYDAQTPTTFSTKSTSPVMITAVKHRHGIRILSEEKTSYKMGVEHGGRKETVTLKEESNKVDGFHSYIHTFDWKTDEIVKLSPISDQMLFKPESKEITAGNDCVDVAFSFIATKGLVINGRIEPQISDAKITLTFPRNNELGPIVTQSNSKGEFRFGPIDGGLEVDIVAEKESYVFSPYDKVARLFKAHKLCEIIVTAKDEQGNKLQGVLLSLSGGESYRKNLVTGDDGTIKFHSLSPSQYFLRPMMKEYKFEPTSKMVEIKDGETLSIELNGKRIAYSVFGQVTSLNGDPFPNIIVEAVGAAEPCVDHQEESSTEINGQYRIRGLQPACTYDIQIKSSDSKTIDHSIPLRRTVTIKDDIKDVNIIGISPIGFVDVIARIYASQNDYYKTLRINMYRKGNADSPIYSQRIESPLNPKSKVNPGIMVFFPRIPLDGKTYIIELSTTLSDKNYKFKMPFHQFLANESSIFTEMEFSPEVRTADNDLNQNSISALVLIAIVAIIFFKQDLALEVLNQGFSKISSAVQELLTKNRRKEVSRFDHVVDNDEIEQLAQSINAVKKKKSKKIN